MNAGLVRALFIGLFSIAGVVAVCGGLALGIVTVIAPDMTLLPHLEHAWLLSLGGFFFMAFFYVAVRLADSVAPAPPAAATAEPQKQAEALAPPSAPAPAGPDAATLLQQMRTYIGLEMWDLALAKANAIVERFPGSKEADIVSRNINEIRWKAEPKPLPSPPSTARAEAKEETRKMLQHVRTYMELEMWELARQKAIEVARLDPESDETAEAGRMLVEIEKKAGSAGAPADGPVVPPTIVEP